MLALQTCKKTDSPSISRRKACESQTACGRRVISRWGRIRVEEDSRGRNAIWRRTWPAIQTRAMTAARRHDMEMRGSAAGRSHRYHRKYCDKEGGADDQ